MRTPLQEIPKISMKKAFMSLPSPLDEALEFGEELFNWV
ncbi:hypothetical protein VD0002_g5012 [Verticillium dahliae]|uniref:Uncharacterized protein n=1 Tax=Verticillium dahliae TaxID=27337 RepID=A0AA45AHC6_VERDA|nr:hypothetical protein BJF96_g9769 [Verticillium dahliae]PNH50590.1 hypothetical protein VD0003_g6587 [Verticillium dahliae]PNH63308.1 hypothetical protein VD0002_g5012 [Verticillium dahliae]